MKRCASSVALIKRCALLITTIVITSNGAFAVEPELNLNLYLEQLELHLQHPPSNDRGKNPLRVWNERKEKEEQVKV